MVTKHIKNLDAKASIKCFDLTIQPRVKGKDGVIRSKSYVISTFAQNDSSTQITIYRFDLFLGTCQEEMYTLGQEDKVCLREENTFIFGIQKQLQYLECSSIPLQLPVNTNEMDVCHLIEKICK